MSERFRKIATRISAAVGSPWAFLLALVMILAWAVTGPLFNFSDTWQLVINTGTTIVTFLMVFLIQNTQNRDSKAIQLKLDELIRTTEMARNSMVDIEELSDAELERLQKEFQRLRESHNELVGNVQETVEDLEEVLETSHEHVTGDNHPRNENETNG